MTSHMTDNGHHPRVILIDPDPGACKETSDQLQSMGFQVVSTHTDPRQAFDLAVQFLPDILVLDGGLEGFSTCEAITTTLLDVEVILILENRDPRSVRQAMLAGARDYLVRYYATQDLAASLSHLHRLAVARKKEKNEQPATPPPPAPIPLSAPADSKLIAVFSPKGGVGCTTVSVNLAVALANKYRVALIDADLQFGDVALFLNLKPRHSIADLDSATSLEPESVHRVLERHASGARVLAAPPRPELADLISKDLLSGALNTLAQSDDYVIVDCGMTLGDQVLSVLDRADVVLLVCTPDIEVLKNLRLYLDLTASLQHPPEKYKIILNKDDPKGLVSREQVQKYLHRDVDLALPRDWNTARAAASIGVPFVLNQPQELLSSGIRRLASTLESIRKPEVTPSLDARRPGIFPRTAQVFRSTVAALTSRQLFRPLAIGLAITAAVSLALLLVAFIVHANPRQRVPVSLSSSIPIGQTVTTSTGMRLAVLGVQRPFLTNVLPLDPGEELAVVSLWIENTNSDTVQTVQPQEFFLVTPWNETYSAYLIDSNLENQFYRDQSIQPGQGFIRRLIFYLRTDVTDLHLVWRTIGRNYYFVINRP